MAFSSCLKFYAGCHRGQEAGFSTAPVPFPGSAPLRTTTHFAESCEEPLPSSAGRRGDGARWSEREVNGLQRLWPRSLECVVLRHFVLPLGYRSATLRCRDSMSAPQRVTIIVLGLNLPSQIAAIDAGFLLRYTLLSAAAARISCALFSRIWPEEAVGPPTLSTRSFTGHRRREAYPLPVGFFGFAAGYIARFRRVDESCRLATGAVAGELGVAGFFLRGGIAGRHSVLVSAHAFFCGAPASEHPFGQSIVQTSCRI